MALEKQESEPMKLVTMALMNNLAALACSAAVAIMADGCWKLLAIPILCCHMVVRTKETQDEDE